MNLREQRMLLESLFLEKMQYLCHRRVLLLVVSAYCVNVCASYVSSDFHLDQGQTFVTPAPLDKGVETIVPWIWKDLLGLCRWEDGHWDSAEDFAAKTRWQTHGAQHVFFQTVSIVHELTLITFMHCAWGKMKEQLLMLEMQELELLLQLEAKRKHEERRQLEMEEEIIKSLAMQCPDVKPGLQLSILVWAVVLQ